MERESGQRVSLERQAQRALQGQPKKVSHQPEQRAFPPPASAHRPVAEAEATWIHPA